MGEYGDMARAAEQAAKEQREADRKASQSAQDAREKQRNERLQQFHSEVFPLIHTAQNEIAQTSTSVTSGQSKRLTGNPSETLIIGSSQAGRRQVSVIIELKNGMYEISVETAKGLPDEFTKTVNSSDLKVAFDEQINRALRIYHGVRD